MNARVPVELRSITKRFGRGAPAVDGVSLVVPGGSLTTLLGPSGSGKTTALMMIAGFVEPDAGEVLIGGRGVTRVPAHRRSIGVVFQHYALFPHKTVFENIAYPLRARKTPRAEIRRRVGAVLETIRLPDVAERYPRQLSGGQQQRVALARALVFEPTVLLMDEPLGALDRKLREQMQVELRTVQQNFGITTISVTHDQEEAMAMSDLVVVMRDGRIEQQGAPGALYERPRSEFIADFLGAANLVAGAVEGGFFAIPGGPRIALAQAAASPAGAARLMIRPERVRWPDEEPAEIRLEGQVAGVTYLGQQIRYRIALPGGQTLMATRPNRSDLAQYQEGDAVAIGWMSADAILL